MTADAASDNVRFYRSPYIEGLELVSARYRRRAFPRHWHEEYVIGAMTAGAEKLAIRGREQVVGCGCLILIEPGEPHANASVDDDPFGYAVVYLPVSLMAGFIREEAAVGEPLGVRFTRPAPYAPDAHRLVVRAHARLIASESPLD